VALCDEFPRYGYRRVTAQLKAEGNTINHKAVSRIMRKNGLQVRPLRRFVRTTHSDHDSPIFPNLTAAFSPTGPNELWLADLTYVGLDAYRSVVRSHSRSRGRTKRRESLPPRLLAWNCKLVVIFLDRWLPGECAKFRVSLL